MSIFAEIGQGMIGIVLMLVGCFVLLFGILMFSFGSPLLGIIIAVMGGGILITSRKRL